MTLEKVNHPFFCLRFILSFCIGIPRRIGLASDARQHRQRTPSHRSFTQVIIHAKKAYAEMWRDTERSVHELVYFIRPNLVQLCTQYSLLCTTCTIRFHCADTYSSSYSHGPLLYLLNELNPRFSCPCPPVTANKKNCHHHVLSLHNVIYDGLRWPDSK